MIYDIDYKMRQQNPMSKIKQKRDKYFKFRLMLSEIEELQEMAQAENLDPSKFVRSRIFSHKRAVA